MKVVALRRNFGQTAALKAGFDAARGDIIISMDGDLQHEPEEIPAFVAKLEEGYDIVSGWRAQRQDPWLTRRLPSRIANWVMAKLSRVPLHDFGTTFKAYRRETIQSIQLYGELHRFIPALAAWSGRASPRFPSTILRARTANRTTESRGLSMFSSISLSTKFLLDFSTRPLHFFGFFGLLAAGTGTLMESFLLAEEAGASPSRHASKRTAAVRRPPCSSWRESSSSAWGWYPNSCRARTTNPKESLFTPHGRFEGTCRS